VLRRLSASLLTIVAIMLGATLVSQAQPQTLLTRHQRQETLNGRTPLVGRLPANQTLHIQIILQHRNQAGLEQFLKEQQDPSSPNYRKILTVEQFTEQYGPSRADYEAVKDFAKQNGLEILSGSRNRMLLQVRGSVANIEKALHVSMSVYQHDTENRTFFAPDREPTPDLAVQLWHIGGLDNYATPKPAFHKIDPSEAANVQSNATTGSGPGASFLGSDMRAAYYVDGNGAATLTGTGQSVGLFEFIGTDLVDLTTYYTNVGQTNNVPVTLTSVDTQKTLCAEPTCDDTEQTLDMTQALGMAPGMSGLTMWIGTGGLSGQTLDDPGILNGMVTANPLQAQLSCSWAWKPTDNTTDDPFFTEMAAQGQTFFAASGDDGNWAHATYVWPADDVNVVSVGGTDLDTSGAAGPWASETGWLDGGGGISPNKFAIPSWQVAAAAGCAKCSQTYRNGPDVSANANFTFYVCADQEACSESLYGGTSFATPMWAGYLALTNQQYLLNGNSTTLGFINPALYAIYAGSNYGTDFHNVTSGGNTLGCTVGYSLSCGLGSPNGDNLLLALAGTQPPGFAISASPTSVTVQQGKSGTSTITTAVSGGFDSSIALSASGQPTGVTATFNPPSIAAPGSGTSTLTLAVASTTARGTYTITVSGTGRGITQKTTVTLIVIGPGNFSITASPTNITVARGASGTSTITSKIQGGFHAPITLSATTNVGTVTFSPNPIKAPGSGTSTMTVKVSSNAALGAHTVTVKGTGEGKSHTTTVTVTVTQ
jgi:subtilase family serine protease